MKEGYEGRVAMFENPENKTITIVLNQLQSRDQGFYWCMSNELREQQSSTELKVVKGKSCALHRTTPNQPAGFFGKSSEPKLTPAALKMRQRGSVLWGCTHRKFP